ncbi:hypothetical protein HXY33_06535 [Candidatus Bathyarchaeota archaeon]|nr:hypothetical protein [Candidatus Bathyarchaeota archaeon]
MSSDLAKMLVNDFLKTSWSCVEVLVRELVNFKGDEKKKVQFYCFRNGRMNDVVVDGSHFFLRSSVEFSNPQLTVEEVQGIIAARLLEVCGNYFCKNGLREADSRDVDQICELLNKPPQDVIIPFLLNTDEIEPDRYSMNPLKESIVTSGQSAFPAKSVKTEQLKIDENFVQKYEGSLISKDEVELIAHHLTTCDNNYMNLVDAVKYDQLEFLSQSFGISLFLCSLRMPLTTLEKEASDGFLHHMIRETHKDYNSVASVYTCMGRSMKNRTTLLTIPHSQKGYASKRVARGKIYFDGMKLKNVKVTYQTTPLYPNAIDPNDVSIATAEDDFSVEGEKLTNYNYKETPSSPQFFLYSLRSPENATLWHGIGAFGAQQLLGSYVSIRLVCAKGSLISNLDAYGVNTRVPLQFNLSPQHMWFHPVHRNIDASIGCIEDLKHLASLGMKVEYLSAYRNPDG